MKSDEELAQLRAVNNPDGLPVGHFTGRCMHCHSDDLWDDNSAYGCNCCGALWSGVEPRLTPNGAPMPQPFKIQQMFGFIATEADGTEGIAAFYSEHTGSWMPMVAADEARLASLLPIAKQIANATGRPITLKRFYYQEVVQEITPEVAKQ